MYLRKYSHKWQGIVCIVVALLIGVLYTKFVYSGLLELLINVLVELGTEAGTTIYEQGHIL